MRNGDSYSYSIQLPNFMFLGTRTGSGKFDDTKFLLMALIKVAYKITCSSFRLHASPNGNIISLEIVDRCNRGNAITV